MARVGSGPSVRSTPSETLETLYGIDRLTGMAALLHLLPAGRGHPLPVLPASAALLPVSEIEHWDAQSYAVSELPHTAALATHPAEVAHGVLTALEALHRAGMAHGGVGTAQFWQVGKDIYLSGAGLPWQPQPTPQDDLRALAAALDELGGRPAALRRLETMTAAQALEALASQVSPPSPAPPGPAPSPSGPTLSGPIVVGSALTAPSPAAPLASEPQTPLPAGLPSASEPSVPAQVPAVRVVPEPAPASSAPPSEDPMTGGGVAPSAPEPVAPQPEAERAAPTPAAPIRIGFDDPLPLAPSADEPASELPLLDWTPPAVPALLPPEPSAAPPVTLTKPPPPAPLPAGPPVVSGPKSGTSGATPRTQPVRIGWEEDHSWRVVRAGGEQVRANRPRRMPRWVWPLLALLLLAAGLGLWGLSRWRGRALTPAALSPAVSACCSVVFRVTGSSTSPVKIWVVEAPGNSPLKPGALLGTAPGTLRFPDVAGPYRLKFQAQGHASMLATLNLPSSLPFDIVLK